MLKQTLLWSLGLLIALQLIQVTLPELPGKIDPEKEIQAPKEIVSMLKTSCYDCHSYQTTMPWYGNIAPFSWEVKGNIKKGRAWLNFEEWSSYPKEKQQKLYQSIAESITLRMPLPMYLTLHEEAELTRAQRRQIKAWAKRYSGK